jgi:prevent-host-death family protein
LPQAPVRCILVGKINQIDGDVMDEIGVFEAKTHFSSLLDRVEKGEEITITRHGKPVAKLVKVKEFDREKARLAFERLKEISKGARLDGLTIQELRDEGRR